MRMLSEDEGFPNLGEFEIGLIRAPSKSTDATDALASHIKDSLGNLVRPLMAAE